MKTTDWKVTILYEYKLLDTTLLGQEEEWYDERPDTRHVVDLWDYALEINKDIDIVMTEWMIEQYDVTQLDFGNAHSLFTGGK